jgi:hypothetical protein
MLTSNPTTYLHIRKPHLREFLIACFGVESTDKLATIRFPARHEANYFVCSSLMKTPRGWKPKADDPQLLRLVLPKTPYTAIKNYLPKDAQEDLATFFYNHYFKPAFYKWMYKRENGKTRLQRIESFMEHYGISPDSFDALKKSDYRNRSLTEESLQQNKTRKAS